MISRFFWRLFIPILCLSILLVGIAVLYIATTFDRFHSERTRGHLLLLTRSIATTLERLHATGLDQACKDLDKRLGIRITVIDQFGKVIADSQMDPQTLEDHSATLEVRQAIKTGTGLASRYSHTAGILLIYAAVQATMQPDQPVVVRTAIPYATVRGSVAQIYTAIIGIAIAMVCLAALLSWLIARQLSNPIAQIQAVATGLSDGNLDLRAPVVGPAELQSLATSFNRMAEQLQQRINTIESQKAQLDAVLAAMSDGLLAVDAYGNVLAANQCIRPFLVSSPDHAISKHYARVVSNLDLHQIIHSVFTDKNKVQQEIKTSDGRHYMVNATNFGQKVTDSGAVLVVHDITQLRRLEQIRKDFVANVSHQLKTPITSIKGYVETLLEGMSADQQAQRYLEVIARQADRIHQIVNDLLTLARLEEYQQTRRIRTEYLPLDQILSEAVGLIKQQASQKAIDIHLSCDKSLHAYVNQALLVQAVTNLLDNAVKYSSAGGHVWIRAAEVAEGIEISVTDNGCGIAKEHLPRIFERFYVVDKAQSKQLGGTGLGLAIVRHIAQIHGGAVDVQSQPGKGSIFTIKLPRRHLHI